MIDRELIVEKDLEDLVYPAFSIVPPENAFWWNPSGIPAEDTLSAPERLELVLQTFKEAGWTWKVEPSWDPGTRQVVPGEEPRTADGQLLPEIQFIFPLHDEDLLMSAFGEAISESLQNLGLPMVIERLPRDQIINRTLVAGSSFDLYILDWRFPLYPGYLCDLFVAENDTLLTGGYNTTGYNSPRFDETCESFLLEKDEKLAQDLAYRLQSQLAFDRPYLPLYHPKIIDLANTSVVPPYNPQLNGFAGAPGFQADTRILLEP